MRQDITLIVILSVLVPLVLLLFICAFRKYNKKNRSDGTLYEVADFGKRLFGVFLEFWAEFMASALRGGSFRRRFISARYYLNNFKKEDFFLSVSTRFVFMFFFVNFIICTFCFFFVLFSRAILKLVFFVFFLKDYFKVSFVFLLF